MAPDWEFKISFRGGNPSLVQPTLQHLFMPVGVKFFGAWCDSICTHPALLHSEIELECIAHYLRKISDPKSKEVQAAITYLFAPLQATSPEPVTDAGNKDSAGRPASTLITKSNHSRTPSSTSSGSLGSNKVATRPLSNRAETEAPKINVTKGESWGDWFKRKVVGNKNRNVQPNYNNNRNSRFY